MIHCHKLPILKITSFQRRTILSLCTWTIRRKKKKATRSSKKNPHISEISRIFPDGSYKVDPYQTGLMWIYLTYLLAWNILLAFFLWSWVRGQKTHENLAIFCKMHAKCFRNRSLMKTLRMNTCKTINKELLRSTR